MSIRPIDFNGMIQNSQEVGSLRQHEEARPMAEQQTIAVQTEHTVEEQLNSVNEFANAESGEDKMDAKDSSGNEYQNQNRGKGKRKKRPGEKPQDRVIMKGQPERFDITI